MGNEQSSSSSDGAYTASNNEGGFWGNDDEESGSGNWFGGEEKPKKGTGEAALDSLSASLNRAGQKMGVVEKPRTIEDEVCEVCPKLTFKQRVIGFCVCVGIGYLLSICATFVLFGGYTAPHIRTFAELYIMGNLVAITATAFFVGPRRMCRRMVAKTRRIGTALWFSLMIAVFVCALCQVPLYVLLLLLVAETIAGIWYAASYIPFGRRMIVACCEASLFSPCPQVCKPVAKAVS